MNVELFRLPRVLEITGLSRSKLYSLVASGQFPQPIKLVPGPNSRAVAWSSISVAEWVETRLQTGRDHHSHQAA